MSLTSFLITNATLIDPQQKHSFVSDILVVDGRISQIAEHIEPTEGDLTVLNKKDQWLIPGLMDAHSSFGEPGREDVETIEEGLDRACHAGFCGLILLPNEFMPIDNQALVKFALSEGKKSLLHVFPMATITAQAQGERLSEMQILKAAGCVAFAEGRKVIRNSFVLRKALEYSRMVGTSLVLFPDEPDLSHQAIINEGNVSADLGIPAMPAHSEEIAIFRALHLAELTKASIHIGPVTTARSLQLIQEAKQRGVKVSCFVATHYLYFNQDVHYRKLAEAKVSPPFRLESDRLALIAGCQKGYVDYLVSDHNPHLPFEVEQELVYAPFGISNLDLSIAIAVTVLFKKHGFAAHEVASLLSSNILQAYSIEQPLATFRVGDEANFTCLNVEQSRAISREDFQGRCYNSPFIGEKLYGFASAVVAQGQLIWNQD